MKSRRPVRGLRMQCFHEGCQWAEKERLLRAVNEQLKRTEAAFLEIVQAVQVAQRKTWRR